LYSDNACTLRILLHYSVSVQQPVPSRQPFAQVYNSVATQPTPEQLARLRVLARQQYAVVPQPQPVQAVVSAPAPTPAQYQGVQPHVQYVPQTQAARPKTVKAGAIGYATQQPGPSVVYQAYDE
jgi:hypothetical protein